MTCRKIVRLAVIFGILSAAPAIAQTGDRSLDIKARVLDVLFQSDIEQQLYYQKLTLRFGDSDSQLVLITYPGGKSEIIRYALAGGSDLSQLISKIYERNRDVKDQDIAEIVAKLTVDVSSSPVDPNALDRALRELKAIRISPMLATRVTVDDYSYYEFWYDTGEELVHYRVTGPPTQNRIPQDKLVDWMIKFRANVPKLLSHAPASTH